jgi:exopolysaccharide biosynthesis polyprenyl glycosylphosphotransferase
MNKISTKRELRRASAAPGSVVRGSGRQLDRRRLRLDLYAILLLADSALILSSFLLADLLRFGKVQGYGFATFVLIFPVYVVVGLHGDCWTIESLQRPRRSAAAVIRALLSSIAVTTILLFSLKAGANFSRTVFGIGSCLALVLLAQSRLLLGNFLGQRYHWNFRRDILLLDGQRADPSAGEIVIDAGKEGLRPDVADPAMLDRLAQLLAGCERVIIACAPDRRQSWTRALAGGGLDVEMLTPELSAVSALELRRHGDVPTLLVGRGPLHLRDRALKRLFDISVSSAALILLAPVMLVVAIAIRIDSRGPVLFRQLRMGRGNRLFEVLKFRTMHKETTDAHGACSVNRHDSRVTPVGRFLRRTSLDELPQLINVLKGDMSIVGPRPHALGTRAGDQLLWTVDERYWNRHAIRPGLTGLAQVRGLRGETVEEEDLKHRLQADLEYVDGWHIGRDIGIVLRTIGVLVHPNAF